MSDLIDREAVLAAIQKERDYMIGREKWLEEHILTHCGYRIVAEFPSAERVGHWIPVNERWPEIGGYYLVTYSICEERYIGIMHYRKVKYRNGLCDVFERLDPDLGWEKCLHPLAWVPLPEPYKDGGGA